MRLFRYELLKLWGRRFFLGALLVLSAVNLFLFWYGGRPASGTAPASAYLKLHRQIAGMTEGQKAAYLNGEYEKLTAYSILNRLDLMRAQKQNDYTKDTAAQLKKDNAALLQTYAASYRKGVSLRYASTLDAELQFISDQRAQLQELESYPQYLAGIRRRADLLSGISVFSSSTVNGGFSGRNIRKTARDFEPMQAVKLRFDVSKGFSSATGFAVTDVVAPLLMFIVAALLIFDEKERGLFALVRPTASGRAATILAKTGVLAVTMGAVTLLLFGGNLFFAAGTMSLGDLSRPLQSAAGFMGGTLRVSVLGYLLIFLAAKFAAYFTVALLIVLVSIYARHPAAAYLACALLLAAEAALYLLIPATSALNTLKYVNLVGFAETNGLFGQYLNLDLLGQPVNLIPVIFTALGAALSLLFAAVVAGFCKKKSMGAGSPPFAALWGKARLPHRRYTGGVLRQEGYKLLVVNRAALLILLFFAFQWYGARGQTYYLTPDELYYQNYMQSLAGPVTAQKELFLKQEQEKFDKAGRAEARINDLAAAGKLTQNQAQTLSEPYSEILAPSQAFEKVTERYLYLKAHPGTRFVYDTGYGILFGGAENGDDGAALRLIVMAILCFSAVFSMEYKCGAVRLVAATPLGREYTVRCKITVCLLAFLPVFAATYAPGLWLLWKTFGFPGLSAPAASLPLFAGWPYFVSVAGAVGLLFLLRAFACVLLILAVLAVSLRARGAVYAMLILSAALAAPAALSLMGIGWAYSVSVLPILTGSPVLLANRGMITAVLGFALPTLVGAGCGACLLKKNAMRAA